VVLAIQLEAMMEGGATASGLPACLLIMLAEILGAGLADLLFRKIYIKAFKKWKQTLS